MAKLSIRNYTLSLLAGLLALTNASCTQYPEITPKSEAATPSQSASFVKSSQSEVKPISVKKDHYGEALALASGAIYLGEEATVRQDWDIVVAQWQMAIKALKKIPNSDSNYSNVQNKMKQYQGYLATAKAKASSPAGARCSENSNPEYFFAPIKDRVAGIPVIEVTLNGKYHYNMMLDTGASHSLITPSMAFTLDVTEGGFAQVNIVNSQVEIPFALVKSIAIDGHVVRDLPVFVAPFNQDSEKNTEKDSESEIGLIGHDFLKGYNLNIKKNVVEFQRQPGVKTNTKVSDSRSCLVDTYPEFFSVPIKRRQHNIPVIEVTLNKTHKFEMMFDTGASHTLVSGKMAKALKLEKWGEETFTVADGSEASLGVTLLDSQTIGTRTKYDVWVAVAPNMDIGLLGQNFYYDYDVVVKKNVIEFRRHRDFTPS